jgi:hypothetical protein
MDVIGAVTAAAAGLAAALSGFNLYVSGRRDFHKWRRDALVEAFVTFMQAGFNQTRACHAIATATMSFDRDHLREIVVNGHDLESETLTRIRLLAPASVVKAAEMVHEAIHKQVEVFFAEPLPAAEIRDSSEMLVRHARTQFLDASRSALRLGATYIIEHPYRGTGWYEFRPLTGRSANPGSDLSAT